MSEPAAAFLPMMIADPLLSFGYSRMQCKRQAGRCCRPVCLWVK